MENLKKILLTAEDQRMFIALGRAHGIRGFEEIAAIDPALIDFFNALPSIKGQPQPDYWIDEDDFNDPVIRALMNSRDWGK